MKINFKGKVTKERIIAKIDEALSGLEDSGIDTFQGVNLYFNTLKDGQRVFSSGHNQQEDSHSIPAKDWQSDERSVRKTDGAVNRPIKTNTDLFHRYSNLKFYSKEELKELKEVAKAQYREASLRRREESARRREESIAERQHRKWISQELESLVRKITGLNERGYKDQLVSSGELKTKQGLIRYTSKELPLPALRCTLKDPNSNKKQVYIFDKDFNLTLQIKDFTTNKE